MMWNQAVEGRNLRLRRFGAHDAAWLKASFAQEAFADAVNRPYAERIRALSEADVAAQLQAQALKSPLELGAHMLLIERLGGVRLGLACLVNLDAHNRRAEFIIGYPGEPPHGVVLLETGVLMAQVAFLRAKLHKVTATFYADNPRVQAITAIMAKVGFVAEGTQREHVRVSADRFVDVHLWAALATDVLSNPIVIKYAQRFLPPESQWAHRI